MKNATSMSELLDILRLFGVEDAELYVQHSNMRNLRCTSVSVEGGTKKLRLILHTESL